MPAAAAIEAHVSPCRAVTNRAHVAAELTPEKSDVMTAA